MAFAPAVLRVIVSSIEGMMAQERSRKGAAGILIHAPLSLVEIRETLIQRFGTQEGYNPQALRGAYETARKSFLAAEKMNTVPTETVQLPDIPIRAPIIDNGERIKYKIKIERVDRKGERYDQTVDVTSPAPLSAAELESRIRDAMDERYSFSRSKRALIENTNPGEYERYRVIDVERSR